VSLRSPKSAVALYPVFPSILLALFLIVVCQLAQPLSGVCASSNATIAENAPMELNLYEAIMLALRTNRTVTSAYMGRVLTRFNYADKKAKFVPNIGITGTSAISAERTDTKYDTADSDGLKTDSSAAGITGTISETIPTGGEFTFVWAGNFDKDWTTGSTDSQDETKSWSASFSQPLLKDGGIDYNTASIKRADMSEQENLLSLRDTVISVISSTITSYRAFLQAKKNLENQEQSLQRAKEQLRINELLIKTGRMAESEIYETQANVARQELNYENNMNSFDQARLTLLDVLDMDSSTQIKPIQQVTFTPITPKFETCFSLAMQNSATIVSARNAVKKSELSVMEAKNQRLWDLNINGQIGQIKKQTTTDDYRQDGWKVGAELSAPFHLYGQEKYEYESPLLSARIALHQSQLSLKEAEDDMRTDILNAVRNVQSALKQVKLAQQSRQLSEKAFETDRLKLRLGRISNKDFITSQDTLSSAQESEVSTIITYLNALTSLDQTLATTLDTYKITFQPTRPEIEKKYMGRLQWMLNQ